MSKRIARAAIKAKHSEIVDYWAAREDESGLGTDWDEAETRCWRCGYETITQRCHIVPDSLGGSSEPSNLVLLCARCHLEAPNFASTRLMWAWIRATAQPCYDTFWTKRGYEEFRLMFGRYPFTGAVFEELFERVGQDGASDLMRDSFAKAYKKSSTHFGESRSNPSTLVGIFTETERLMLGRRRSFVPARLMLEAA